jgi:phosphopantetheinyl transferase (holo-ACP synthase)
MIYRIKKYPCEARPLRPEIRFYVSRQALKASLSELLPHQNFLTWEDLTIVGHHHLRLNPKILVSLSHTGLYGAAVCALKNREDDPIVAVGIDVEPAERPCSPAVAKFFVNSSDETTIPLLKLWSCKEAAFKAMAPLVQHQLTLKKIWIQERHFGIDGDHQAYGSLLFPSNHDIAEDLLIVVAKMTRAF